MLRKLRIAFSAGCGILCVLLIALWIHSYYYSARLFLCKPIVTGSFSIASTRGEFRLRRDTLMITDNRRGWSVNAYSKYLYPKLSRPWRGIESLRDFGAGFRWWHNRSRTDYGASFPHWFPILLISALAAAPWIRWRFGLRTLLIVATLVAMGLGMLVV